MDISNQIKTRREAMGLSQEQLAEKLYVSRQTISNWERERTYSDDELDRKQTGAEDRIIVLSTFTTNWRSTNEGFSPNETYEDWQWILTRPTQNAAWSVEGWGYC